MSISHDTKEHLASVADNTSGDFRGSFDGRQHKLIRAARIARKYLGTREHSNVAERDRDSGRNNRKK